MINMYLEIKNKRQNDIQLKNAMEVLGIAK